MDLPPLAYVARNATGPVPPTSRLQGYRQGAISANCASIYDFKYLVLTNVSYAYANTVFIHTAVRSGDALIQQTHAK